MNATLNFNAITSSGRPQWSLHQPNKNSKAAYYSVPQVVTHTTTATTSRHNAQSESDNEERTENAYERTKDSYTCNSTPTRAPANFFDDDRVLLESAYRSSANYNAFPPKSLHKSNSYSGSIRPKTIVLKQNYPNGRIATSLTDDEIVSSSYRGIVYAATSTSLELTSNTLNNYDNDATVDLDDENDLLMPPTANAFGGVDASYSSSATGTRRNTRGAIKARNRNWCSRKIVIGFLLLLLAIVAFLCFAYLTRDYTKQFLLWIEMQNPWVIVSILLVSFMVVSFPIIVGYFVLMLTSGYLFGAIKGILIIITGANVGIAIVHWTVRSFRHRIPIHKIIKNETARAILRVISGPKAFRVVLFTRLTPIPFGVQNMIFAVSTINPRVYHTASLIGLLPAQIINAYLGSTLRSMQEVLSNHGTAVTGYISFGLEVICGVALMVWVIQKARKELAQTLLSEVGNDGKLIEIDV
ncbi:transmembrane protein 64 [Bactrocera dorsalis]|uniref:Transmembrane protein 64 n=1 Tax=Bactrocera dorsalis TaxID=27457 RepID=A0A6I9V5V9_BACDO|nr:transmembrane protein 64 [Bactrocera dorsalis]XP_049315368.1 transmembrane protein 64 [Bactrocera dorsalis]